MENILENFYIDDFYYLKLGVNLNTININIKNS